MRLLRKTSLQTNNLNNCLVGQKSDKNLQTYTGNNQIYVSCAVFFFLLDLENESAPNKTQIFVANECPRYDLLKAVKRNDSMHSVACLLLFESKR